MGATCKTCGGTGWAVCLASHIVTDRTHKERCGICAGSGKSRYQDSSWYVRWQERARASFPRHPDYAGEA